MVVVGRHGAFSVNSVGLGGAPFPLSFSVREVNNSRVVDAAAAQAVELVDVLERAANDTIVVVDVATNSFLDEAYVQWRPSRIAAEQGVSCEVHPLGALAAGVVGLSEEVLVMRRDDLARFLANWSPYELTLIDVPGTPTPERLDEIALAIGTATNDEPVLPALVGSCLWFSGHDDCYAAVESTDRAMPAAVLGRLLALLVGSALGDDSSVDVPDADGAIVEALIEESRHWIGALSTMSENSVTVELSATSERWRLGQRLPERIDHTAVYDVALEVWRLAAPPRRE
jgi:hypothetical protein